MSQISRETTFGGILVITALTETFKFFFGGAEKGFRWKLTDLFDFAEDILGGLLRVFLENRFLSFVSSYSFLMLACDFELSLVAPIAPVIEFLISIILSLLAIRCCANDNFFYLTLKLVDFLPKLVVDVV